MQLNSSECSIRYPPPPCSLGVCMYITSHVVTLEAIVRDSAADPFSPTLARHVPTLFNVSAAAASAIAKIDTKLSLWSCLASNGRSCVPLSPLNAGYSTLSGFRCSCSSMLWRSIKASRKQCSARAGRPR